MLNHSSYRKVTLSLFLSFLFLYTIQAQNETANWFFGENAGLSFNTGFPNIDLNGQLITTEGCSTISNKQGQLLFYTDGVTVWSKNHSIMQNGTGLTGDDSSTQSAIIIPRPDSDTIYYIFTVDARAGTDGLRYSEVDISLNGGLGAITSNKNILLETPTTEKITAVESADGESIWVISHKWNSDEFIAYLVSNAGINTTPIVSAVGSMHQGNTNNSIGYLKASPNREKIASVISYVNNKTEIFDFNAASGIISNPVTIANYTSEDLGPYGCEFSPDSRLLYVSEIIRGFTDVSKIHQYDLTQNTQQQIIDSDVVLIEEGGLLGAIQQALDGKLYVAKFGGSSIGVINNPNELGLNAEYEPESLFLGGKVSNLGLPPFIQSYFFATNIFNNTCFGDTTEFGIDTSTVIDSILWDFGDTASGSENTSSNLAPTHIFTSSGNYDITITIQTEGETQIIYRTLNISDQPPILDLENLIACEDEENTSTSFNLTNAVPTNILEDPSLILTYYQNLSDANDRINGISSPSLFTTDTNQTIYVRTENSFGSDCYSISSFDISINNTPDIEFFESVFFCQNETTEITIDVGNLPLPISNYSFLWLESGQTTPLIQVNSAGDYIVRIVENISITPENPEGCYADRIVTVNSSSIAIVNNIEISGISASIFVSGLGDYEYAVDNENGIYQDSSYFSNLTPGVHIIYVKDKNNCGIIEKEFSIIYFPKYFTPNGDSRNDYWQVFGLSLNFQSNAIIYIFDRFGKLITQINPNGKGWDGTSNGNPLPSNDYWFSVTLEDGREYKSHFTLKR